MKGLFLYFILLASVTLTFATNIKVSSVAALQAAINDALAGDIIILTDGTYLNSVITIGTSNITVKTDTPGGAYLNGTNDLTVTGRNVTLSGFQFTSGTSKGSAIKVYGNNNTLTQLNFNGYSAAHLIIIHGQNNLITNCNFQNKPATNLVSHGGTGDLVQIIPDSALIGYNTIRYCSFQHIPGFGGDYGNECIRIGDGAYSTFSSGTVVEYCYFEDTGNGDSEAISVKSRDNCLRYNTMFNNPDAMFAFRNGDNNVAYSNYFIKSGGIRIKQANNIFCYNNYFQQAGMNQNQSLHGKRAAVFLEYFGPGYGNNLNFIHNSFYKCANTIIDSNLTNCSWANNIFYSDSSAIFTGTASGQSFTGNIYFGLLGLAIPNGMANLDPKLTLNPDGYFGLSSTSPAIGSASPEYPAILSLPGLNNDPNILLDIEGQSRPEPVTLKDAGCDQFSKEAITNRPLALCDVGPSYLCSITTINPVKVETYNSLIYPNPNYGIFYVKSETVISKIEIINLFGEVIRTIDFNQQFLLIEINLTAYSKGIYFVRITDTKRNVTNKKIVIL